MTFSDLVQPVERTLLSVVAVGSCLVVAGGRDARSVQVLDTYRNCVWNLPFFPKDRKGCTIVTVGSQIVVVGGIGNESCTTLPVMDKNTWCFWRLSEPQTNVWYRCRRHCEQKNGFQNAHGTVARKRARTNSPGRGGEKGTDTSGVHDVAPCPTTETRQNGPVAPKRRTAGVLWSVWNI